VSSAVASPDDALVVAVVVTWNKRAEVLRLLESLRHSKPPPGGLAILVVDNASRDDTVSAIREGFPEVLLEECVENRGGAGGFHLGMRLACARFPAASFLWLLDDDAVVEADSLLALLAAMGRHPNAGICGSRIVAADDPRRLIEAGGNIDWRRGATRSHRPGSGAAPDAVFSVDYVAACSLLLRSPLVAELGGFEEDLFIYWDDVEWCTRARSRGHEVLAVNASRVRHPTWESRDADASVIWRSYYHYRNALWFFHRYRAQWRRPALLARIAARCVLLSLRTAAMARPRLADAALLAVEDFLAGRMGQREFEAAPSDLLSHLKEANSPGICVLSAGAQQSEDAGRFVASLQADLPSLRVAAIECAEGRAFRRKDRLRALATLLRHPGDVLVISASAARAGLHWGLVARVDFEAAKVVTVEGSPWGEIPGRMIRALALLARVSWSTHANPGKDAAQWR
jgi:GT2 family glycosyltransferase